MKKKILVVSLAISIIFVLLIFGFVIYQAITTYQAHGTFDGYCKWRHLEVVNQSSDFGYCKDAISGQVFKMVLVDGRWYLDGDLPNNWPF
jgi:hypothetical protein